MAAMGERRSSRSGLVTRDRIIDAVLRTVRDEGLVGTSVRQIARTGGFNQALIFYHFGSVDELLLAALERANERRIACFRERLEAVRSLSDLVRVAGPLVAGGGRLLAMKGRFPEDELAKKLNGWKVVEVRRLVVPGLDEERHVVELCRSHDKTD